MLLELFFIGLLLYVIIGPKGSLVINMHKFSTTEKLSFLDKVICHIPAYNSYVARRTLDKSGMFELVAFFLIIIFEVTNLIIKFVFFQSPVAMVVGTLLAVTGIIMWVLVEVILMVSLNATFQKPIYQVTSLVPPIAAFFLSRRVEYTVREQRHNLEGTFNGKRTKRKSGESRA